MAFPETRDSTAMTGQTSSSRSLRNMPPRSDRRRWAEIILLAWVIGTFLGYLVQFGPIIRIIATRFLPW